jgi:hypothetical protein
MATGILVLYWVCSISGLIMMAGGIWLIYKEKIYIDRETKQVTEVELPWLGKFRTNVPALVLFVIGLASLIYPIYQSKDLTKPTQWVAIKGQVQSEAFPVYVYAVSNVDALRAPRTFKVEVPLLAGDGGRDCRVLYVWGTALAEDLVNLNEAKDGVLEVSEKHFGQTGTTYEPVTSPTPVPQDYAQD